MPEKAPVQAFAEDELVSSASFLDSGNLTHLSHINTAYSAAGQPLIKMCPKSTRQNRLKLENKRLKGQFRGENFYCLVCLLYFVTLYLEWDTDELADLKVQASLLTLQYFTRIIGLFCLLTSFLFKPTFDLAFNIFV